jgi:hypothetical protein
MLRILRRHGGGAQFAFGVGVVALAGCAPGFGAGSSLTSLGTTTPLPVSGTAGKAASGEVASALAGVCGGGSVLAFGAHAASTAAPTAKISGRQPDFIAITRI